MSENVMLCFSDLRAMGISYSRAHIGRLEAAGKFPKRLRLGSGDTGRVAWLRKEVEGWIEEKMRERG